MLIPLPTSDVHPQVRLTVNTPKGVIHVTTDDRHRFQEVELPPGVTEEEVEVIAEFCKRDGKPDPYACAILLKEREEPDHVHGRDEEESAESGLHVRLEDSAAQEGSEADDAHTEARPAVQEFEADEKVATAGDPAEVATAERRPVEVTTTEDGSLEVAVHVTE